MDQKQQTTCIPCGVRTFLRNTYYNGKLLVEKDFVDEQAYMVGKDRLHNSLLHGSGTVCGLKVLAHPNPECQDLYVYIEPGVALDCCGREIVVTQNVLVELPQPVDRDDDADDTDGEDAEDLFISLCYQEALTEKVPVILPDCDCADANQAYNRVSEGYSVHLFTQPAGQRAPERPPLEASLDWLHTLALTQESPRALAVDEERRQLYVAAQAFPDADFVGERLYVFDTDTHDQRAIANAGSNPTDLALSLLGDRIYLATELPTDDGGEGEDSGETAPAIAIFLEATIRSQPEPTKVIPLAGPARLVVSERTGALAALVLDNGEGHAVLQSWSDEVLRDWVESEDETPPAPDELIFDTAFDGLGGAAMLHLTLNGRYLFIADADGGAIHAVDMATFTTVTQTIDETEHPLLESEDRPLAVISSRDSEYLYVLWQRETMGEEGTDTFAVLNRYRLDVIGSLLLVPDGAGGAWETTPLDLALAPDERWAYVLETQDDQGYVQAVSVESILGVAPPTAEQLLGTRENISGTARFQHLAVLGGRLYVAADDEASEEQPQRGLVAVLRVEEADCEDILYHALDGCPACADEQEGDNSAGHCLVLAHIPNYRPGMTVKNANEAGPDEAAIDNITHRPLVPSTNNIVEVIRCMLDQGIVEGVPGPRGKDGAPGPGVTEVELEEPVDDEPSARLEIIEEDPAGNRRLILALPPGPQGDPGERGPGIVDVEVTTLASGSAATAELETIPGDPEADQRLLLGIPRGEPGPPADDPELTHIIGLSWEHDGIISDFDEFQNLLFDPNPFDVSPRNENLGLVILFDRPIQADTVFQHQERDSPESPTRSEVFQLYARHLDRETGLLCECIVANARHQAVEVLAMDDNRRIREIEPRPGESETQAVRLFFMPNDFPPIFDTSSLFLRIILRADFVLDTEELAVDGNHLGGRLPSGNGRQGDTFESWFTFGQRG